MIRGKFLITKNLSDSRCLASGSRGRVTGLCCSFDYIRHVKGFGMGTPIPLPQKPGQDFRQTPETWEVPGMTIMLPARGSHPPLYAQTPTDPLWLSFDARIPLDARGQAATLVAAGYFWLLQIERDSEYRWPRLEPIFRSVGRRSRNLLMWTYRRITKNSEAIR